jgi:hypothetical protein
VDALVRTNTQLASEALLRSVSSTDPPAPTPSETVQVPFSFATPSPLVLQAVTPGQIVNRALVRIVVPFNDPAATIELGTSAAPGSILATSDINTGLDGQYETDVIVIFSVGDLLLLTLSPGASTQGSGMLLYKIK